MPLKVKCPNCEKVLNLRDDLAGKRVRCNGCSEPVSIPKRTTSSPSKPAASSDDGEDEYEDYGAGADDYEASPVRRPIATRKKKIAKRKRSGSGLSLSEQLSRYALPVNDWTIGLGTVLICAPLGFVNQNFWVAMIVVGLVYGMLLNFVGGIRVLMFIASESILMLLVCLFVPFGNLICVILYWEGVREHIILQLKGVAFIFGSIFVPLIAIVCFGVGFAFAAMPFMPPNPNQGPGPGFNAPMNADGANPAMPFIPVNPLPSQPSSTVAGRFPVETIPIPRFLDPRTPLLTPQLRLQYFDIQTASQTGLYHPGCDMKLRMFVPQPAAAVPRSRACILYPVPGSNLIRGKALDQETFEGFVLPFVVNGMTVVMYSLDGDRNQQPDEDPAVRGRTYREFNAACAGIVNGRNALEFVLANVPEVDPKRVYVAGYEMAATLSLLLAEHEPRLRGCIALDPVCDTTAHLRPVLSPPDSNVLPGIHEFAVRISPTSHLASLQCPTFVFSTRSNPEAPAVPVADFVNRAQQQQRQIRYLQGVNPDHVRSIVHEGSPKSLEWLRDQFGEIVPDPQAGASVFPAASPPGARNELPANPGAVAPRTDRVLREPRAGERVIILNYTVFAGTGDPLTAAFRALQGKPGVDPSVLKIDGNNRKIVMLQFGNSVITKPLSEALEAGGFRMAPGMTVGPWNP